MRTALIDELGHEMWSTACRFLLPELSCFSQIGHIIFRVLVALRTSVPFACRFVSCSSKIKVDRQTHAHTHTDGHTKYRNPCCACALRVNYSDLPAVSFLRLIYTAKRQRVPNDCQQHSALPKTMPTDAASPCWSEN